MAAEAYVVAAGQTGTQPVGTQIPILGGDVQLDATAGIRSTLDLTTDGTNMWPTRSTDLLAPYGNEVFIRRGVRFGNGSAEWISLGYFRIQTPSQKSAPNGPIRIDGRDRMAGIVDAGLLAARQFDAGRTRGSVVEELVTEVYPWATIEWDDPAVEGATLGRTVIADKDRYKFLNDLITSAGRIWYWDYRGVLVIHPEPDPTAPVWEVNTGAGGVLVNLSRELSRDGVYNIVVATGEGADETNPVRGVAYDDNPNSPTYIGGPFGPVPRRYSSPLLTTSAQCIKAARTVLRRSLGLPYSVDFTAIPNPALEPWDPVTVTYPGRSETHVIDTLKVPLVATAALSATTREQSTILIGESV